MRISSLALFLLSAAWATFLTAEAQGTCDASSVPQSTIALPSPQYKAVATFPNASGSLNYTCNANGTLTYDGLAVNGTSDDGQYGLQVYFASVSPPASVSIITSNSTGQTVAVLPTNYSSPLVTGAPPSPADLAPARGLIGPVPAGTTPPFAGVVAFSRTDTHGGGNSTIPQNCTIPGGAATQHASYPVQVAYMATYTYYSCGS
ncbi:hypothetical protein ABPG77_004930 [Micractinium sp. CCAP 211/92]